MAGNRRVVNGERIRIAVAGLGRGFMLTLPALRAHPKFELAGAFDPREAARDAFAREFGAPSFDSLEGLLDAPTINAVYIASPHEFHVDQAVAALDAGKHVLVEKPMAASATQCRAMVAAARRTGKVLLVGPSHAYDAPVLHAAGMVASGRFGRVRHVTALNQTDFMYRPRRREELSDAQTGGVVFSQASHQFDLVRRIVGRSVRTVRAVAGDWDGNRPGIGAYSALATFDCGATASLSYSGYAHFDSDELLGWVSELGFEKDPSRYGEARRQFALRDPADEDAAKLTRTYGGGGETVQTAPHHEHFGFVLISCDDADLRLMPNGIAVYANETRYFETIAPPLIPRCGILDAFAAAVRGPSGLHDGSAGLETVAFCEALLTSSRASADVALDLPLHSQKEH